MRSLYTNNECSGRRGSADGSTLRHLQPVSQLPQRTQDPPPSVYSNHSQGYNDTHEHSSIPRHQQTTNTKSQPDHRSHVSHHYDTDANTFHYRPLPSPSSGQFSFNRSNSAVRSTRSNSSHINGRPNENDHRHPMSDNQHQIPNVEQNGKERAAVTSTMRYFGQASSSSPSIEEYTNEDHSRNHNSDQTSGLSENGSRTCLLTASTGNWHPGLDPLTGPTQRSTSVQPSSAAYHHQGSLLESHDEIRNHTNRFHLSSPHGRYLNTLSPHSRLPAPQHVLQSGVMTPVITPHSFGPTHTLDPKVVHQGSHRHARGTLFGSRPSPYSDMPSSSGRMGGSATSSSMLDFVKSPIAFFKGPTPSLPIIRDDRPGFASCSLCVIFTFFLVIILSIAILICVSSGIDDRWLPSRIEVPFISGDRSYFFDLDNFNVGGGAIEDRDARMIREALYANEISVRRPNAPPIVKSRLPKSSSSHSDRDPLSRRSKHDEVPDSNNNNAIGSGIIPKSWSDENLKLGLGEDGLPIWHLGRQPRKLENDEIKMVLEQHEGFNGPLSDSLPLIRPFIVSPLPVCNRNYETLYDQCNDQTGSCAVSIVIPIHNEPLSMILRTLHTLYQRTPRDLLREVILIDDGSTASWLTEKSHTNTLDVNYGSQGYQYYDTAGRLTDPIHLVDYIGFMPGNIRFFRTGPAGKPQGTNYAKAVGMERAAGDIVVFLDAHVEVGVTWLEPIIERIRDSPTSVVVPRVHHLLPETLAVSNSIVEPPVGFYWKMLETPLSFERIIHAPRTREREVPADALQKYPDWTKEMNVRQSPIVTSPVLAGGIFGVHRQTFTESMGGFDLGMPGTAGMDGLEMSFRIWMTGGRIEFAKCSDVEHAFRRNRSSSLAMDQPSGTLQIVLNKLRTMLLWMDEWAIVPFQALGRPSIPSITDLGEDLGERIRWRRSHPIAKKRSFQWYMDNVYTESTLRSPGGDLIRFQRLQNAGSEACLSSGLGRHQIGRTPLALRTCGDANKAERTSLKNLDFIRDHPSEVTLFHLMHGLHSDLFLFDKPNGRLMPGTNDEAMVCSSDGCDPSLTKHVRESHQDHEGALKLVYGASRQVQFMTTTGKCLAAPKPSTSANPSLSPIYRSCDRTDPYQWWITTPQAPDAAWISYVLSGEEAFFAAQRRNSTAAGPDKTSRQGSIQSR